VARMGDMTGMWQVRETGQVHTVLVGEDLNKKITWKT
jgi:hypothetical protein